MRKPKHGAAYGHEENGDTDTTPTHARLLCHFEADGPANLEKPCKNQVNPAHANELHSVNAQMTDKRHCMIYENKETICRLNASTAVKVSCASRSHPSGCYIFI
ncbi:MAG: hypothetical protein NG747_04130 [Candidatus Brocadia sp.]|nr:hypothetical protein [Candidatus Brocadia sp.]